MLMAAEKPLIVAGGGIINADASDLLVEFAELTGVPVIPTLMGWGTIPDDHPLMAGMVGLQTSHRYGNATMLASDFVLGIGNRWANRHTGSHRGLLQGPHLRARRHRADADRPRLQPRPRHRQRRQGGAGALRAGGARAQGRGDAEGLRRLGRPLRRAQEAHAPQDPLHRDADQAAARVRGDERRLPARHRLRHHHRPEPDRRRAVPARLRPAPVDQLRPGRPAGLDDPGRAGRGGRRPHAHGGGPVGRLRLPVPDRGAGGGRAVQPALRAGAGEQQLPRPHPPEPARLRDGLLRAARLRQPECRRTCPAGLRRRPHEGRRRPGLQGAARDRPREDPGRPAPGAADGAAVPGAGRG